LSSWFRGPALLALASILAGLAVACGGGRQEREITQTRTVRTARPIPPMAPFDDSVRFGLDPGTAPPAGHGPAGSGPAATGPAEGGPAAPTYAWDLPPGWSEGPAGPMRLGSFRVDGHPDLDVSLIVLPGDGGGAAANVNRWRKQMGLDPITDADAAALPPADVLGAKGILVRLDGAYRGMGGGEAQPDFRLLGVVVPDGGSTLFLKMVGPAPAVAEQEASLLALGRSLRRAASAEVDLSKLRPVPPEGWTVGPAKPMRLATYHPGGREDVECSLVVLTGTGGGLDANVNRWRQQMGQAPLSAQEIAALPEIDVLGRPSPVVEIEGTYTAMDGASTASALLLGVIVQLPRECLYVKMTGPADAVRAERERLVRFCESLR
jgi:hypothetical protein